MTGDFVEAFIIALSVITTVILSYLLFSKHHFKITLVGFWKNVLLLIIMLLVSRITGFFGYAYFSELIFLIFSFMVMVIMIVSFVFHYPTEQEFEVKKMKELGK